MHAVRYRVRSTVYTARVMSVVSLILGILGVLAIVGLFLFLLLVALPSLHSANTPTHLTLGAVSILIGIPVLIVGFKLHSFYSLAWRYDTLEQDDSNFFHPEYWQYSLIFNLVLTTFYAVYGFFMVEIMDALYLLLLPAWTFAASFIS